MKNLLVSILLVFVSAQAFSAELRLSSGESATIQANQTTRVSCEGGNGGGSSPASCEQAVDGLKQLLEACRSGGYPGSACMEKYWPGFKQASPTCAYSAISICIEACRSGGFNPSTCAEKCSR